MRNSLVTYISYSFTLLSAIMVWWIFGLFATVASGYTWLPISAFLASILQFGIGSWLFLGFSKTGKTISILLTLVRCVWPVAGFFSEGKEADLFLVLYFLIIVVLSAIVIFNHIRSFNESWKPKPRIRLILSAIPFSLFFAYVITTFQYFF